MPQEIFDFYKIAIELHLKESDRYWTRNNVFILLNGALLAFFGEKFEYGDLLFLFISSFAFIICTIWLGILFRGKNQIERWRKVIDYFENNFKKELRIFRKADCLSKKEINKIKIPTWLNKSASKLMQYIVVIFMVLWLLMFVALIIITIINNARI